MRKLVAIMFTDIEGFTSLMQTNESEAIQLVDRYKLLVQNKVKHFDGRLIKYMGDGTLSVFTSSFQAVSCAVALQQEFRKDKIIPVRIGIHQGEVILENKDVVGDAVNLSSRIQNAGVSGSVLISEKVNDELCNHPELITAHLGSFLLKNISQPVHLFALKSPNLVVPARLHVAGSAEVDKLNQSRANDSTPSHSRSRHPWRVPLIITIAISVLLTIILFNIVSNRKDGDDLKTIAVLPFKNIGMDTGQSNYISEALTEEIINILSSNLKLKVRKIALRPNESELPNLAGLIQNLGATNILDCSVQRFNDSLKIFAFLRSSDKNEIIWNETYIRPYSQQISLQQELAQEIADALQTGFTKDQMREMAKNTVVPPDAYDLYIRGRHEQNKRDKHSMENALDLFQKAVVIYPNYAKAWAAISDNYTIRVDNGVISFDSGYANAKAALEKAEKINPELPEVYASRGIFLGSMEGKHKDALKALAKAVSIRNTDAFIHQYYAVELMADGKLNEALDQINLSIELEPQVARRQLYLKNVIFMQAKRFAEAKTVQYQLLEKFGDTNLYNVQNAERCYRMKKMDSVTFFAGRIRHEAKDQLFWNALLSADKSPLKKRVMEDHSYSDLEIQAFYLTCLNDNAKALDRIESAYNAKEYSWLRFLNVDPDWEPLKKEPRFEAMLNKLDLN